MCDTLFGWGWMSRSTPMYQGPKQNVPYNLAYPESLLVLKSCEHFQHFSARQTFLLSISVFVGFGAVRAGLHRKAK